MPRGYNSPYRTCIFGPIEVLAKDLVSNREVYFKKGKFYPNRKELERFIEKLEKSVKKDGIKRPLEIAWHLTPKRIEQLEISVGESRYYVAKKLGMKKLPCYLCIYVYKINSYTEKENLTMDKFVEGLKKILPFQGEKSGEGYGVVPTIPYKR